MGSIECEIPVIDISPWLDGSGRDDVVDKIRGACITYGFFQLVGHGVPIALQHEAFDCAKRFFSLPLEEKMALAKDPWTGRGYEMSGSQALQAGEAPDTKEAFRIGRDVPPEDPNYGKYLYGRNVWPNLPENEFKTPITEYRNHMLRLATEIIKILACGMPGSATIFDEFMSDPVASVKLLHYPPQGKVGGATLGAGAHRDFGAITLLLQHPGQEGLEVLHPAQDSWIPIPTTEDTYVVNIGDVLNAWTNGHYRSVLHRVINKDTGDRYSIPFFYDGTMSTMMTSVNDVSEGSRIGKTVGQHFQDSFGRADLKA